MTSTIYSDKKVFKKLVKWAFSRNKARMIVFSIMIVVGIFLDLYAIYRFTVDNPNLSHQNMNARLAEMGYGSIVIAQVGAAIFALISAIHTFSFLHNKRTTDMFGAIPSTRGQLYFSHLLSGMASVMIPFTAGSFIVMAISCRSGEAFTAMLGLILFGILSIAAVYSFTALIAYCCGTIVDTALITIGVNIIYTGATVFFWGTAVTMIPGLSFSQMVNTPVIGLFSPYSFFIFYDVFYFSGQSTAMWMTVAWSMVFTAGMIALGYFAAKNRRAEVAQNEFNIRWLPIVIKAGMSIVCGGLVGLFAAGVAGSSFGNMFIFAFWYIIAGFAAFFILHLIFARGLKGKFRPSLFAYIGTTVVSLALVFAMTTGIGLDTYVPDASNIKSADIGYVNKQFTERESIELITKVHKLVIDGELKANQRPYGIGAATNMYNYNGSYTYDYEASMQFENEYPLSFNLLNNAMVFNYTKNIGFNTYRAYMYRSAGYDDFDSDELEATLRSFYNTDEYRKYSNSGLWAEEGAKRNGKSPTLLTVDSYEYTRYTDEESGSYSNEYICTGTKHLKHDEDFVAGLMNAMKQDIMDDKEYYKTVVPTWSEDKSVSLGDGYLTIRIGYYKANETTGQSMNPDEYYSADEDISVVVPMTYTRTMDYLIENGIKTA